MNSTAAVHLMVEAERRVYADRATHLGDPDFYPVPLQKLLEKGYSQYRMESFSPDEATPSLMVAAGNPAPGEFDAKRRTFRWWMRRATPYP